MYIYIYTYIYIYVIRIIISSSSGISSISIVCIITCVVLPREGVQDGERGLPCQLVSASRAFYTE